MPNRLAQETSPYLLQHAENPVEWYPWGEEAMQRARQEDKPILLSVGYSACHWCHVMAHESFEDPEIAAIMNRLFINIKVDREERPDIDQIYQTAHQMLVRRGGGWPLTMFLAPDQRPFFGGTYFPKTARYQLPGFGDLLKRVAQAYATQRQEIAQQNAQLVEMLQHTVATSAADTAPLSDVMLDRAAAELKKAFDPVHGGIGSAPKFPHPFELAFCLHHGVGRKDPSISHVALHTLEQMALGGIYDQLGGGFCRYSVDKYWTIPHFEKMLYDNGPLLALYADAFAITGNALFKRVCEETAGWVMGEMQSPQGAFYSSLDADSEHQEGKFYVWNREEVQTLLSNEEYEVVARHFGLDGAPNFENEFWHLRITASLDAGPTILASAKTKLLRAREKRVRPGRDDKVLVSWNALMIQGLVHAGRVLDRDDWIQSARRALSFIQSSMWREHRLLATYKDGRAHLNAYLDDYALLLVALLELMQAEYRQEDLQFAVELAEVLLGQFEDRAAGGFFFTSHEHEPLILRPKPAYDYATPAGNGVAAVALQRLGHLLGETRYLSATERTLNLFSAGMQQHASGYASLCLALAEYLRPPAIIVLRGAEAEVRAWQKALGANFRPSILLIGLPFSVSGLPGVLDKPASSRVNAWVCQGVSCREPIADYDALTRVLDSL